VLNVGLLASSWGAISLDCVKLDTLLRKCLKMRQSRLGVAHGITPGCTQDSGITPHDLQ
jgi:hypothetical protein